MPNKMCGDKYPTDLKSPLTPLCKRGARLARGGIYHGCSFCQALSHPFGCRRALERARQARRGAARDGGAAAVRRGTASRPDSAAQRSAQGLEAKLRAGAQGCAPWVRRGAGSVAPAASWGVLSFRPFSLDEQRKWTRGAGAGTRFQKWLPPKAATFKT